MRKCNGKKINLPNLCLMELKCEFLTLKNHILIQKARGHLKFAKCEFSHISCVAPAGFCDQ